MAHDREFQRKRKDTRMPVRDSHGEDQPAARQTEQDFDLRRARDTPSSVNGKTHRQDIPVQTEFSHLSPETCLLYTSPSPRDSTSSRMPSSA